MMIAGTLEDSLQDSNQYLSHLRSKSFKLQLGPICKRNYVPVNRVTIAFSQGASQLSDT